jgi:hypothetical protein
MRRTSQPRMTTTSSFMSLPCCNELLTHSLSFAYSKPALTSACECSESHRILFLKAALSTNLSAKACEDSYLKHYVQHMNSNLPTRETFSSDVTRAYSEVIEKLKEILDEWDIIAVCIGWKANRGEHLPTA